MIIFLPGLYQDESFRRPVCNSSYRSCLNQPSSVFISHQKHSTKCSKQKNNKLLPFVESPQTAKEIMARRTLLPRGALSSSLPHSKLGQSIIPMLLLLNGLHVPLLTHRTPPCARRSTKTTLLLTSLENITTAPPHLIPLFNHISSLCCTSGSCSGGGGTPGSFNIDNSDTTSVCVCLGWRFLLNGKNSSYVGTYIPYRRKLLH